MKHTFKVTLILVLLFLAAQLIGLTVINNYNVKALPYNIERPEFEESTSYIPVFITIIVATFIALLLLKTGALKLWKIWFFIGVLFTLLISFGAFMSQIAALIFAIIFALIKIFKPTPILHNFTELFIYGGLAAIFVPLFNITSISILLIIIAIYDIIAVWKTKHMVSLAKFQAKAKVFAGLLIPYAKKKSAVLGGGDIGFPLLFAGVIFLKSGWLNAIIVTIFVTMSCSISKGL